MKMLTWQCPECGAAVSSAQLPLPEVWAVLHDEGWDGGLQLLGIYATEAAAREAITTRNANGRPSRSFNAHDPRCCEVVWREVQR